MLLRRGADVNAQDEDGLSPLLLAVRGRYLQRPRGGCLDRAASEGVAGFL